MKVPTAPKTEKPAEKSPEVKPVEASNHAADLIGFVKPFQESGYRCLPWTGEGTKYPGLDAYVCQGPTQIVWCAAPLMGKPICDTVLDWTDPKTKKPAAKATAPQK